MTLAPPRTANWLVVDFFFYIVMSLYAMESVMLTAMYFKFGCILVGCKCCTFIEVVFKPLLYLI